LIPLDTYFTDILISPSSAFDKDNRSSSKVQRILSALAWAVKCDISFDDALLTITTKKYKEPKYNYILFEKKRVWNRDLFRTVASLRNGTPLNIAMDLHLKQYFPDYVIPAITEAEEHGSLNIVLPILAQQMQYSHSVMTERFISAVYPVFVLFQTLALASLLGIFIIPRFSKIFEEMLEGEPLPQMTTTVFSMSESAGYLMMAGILLIPSIFIARFFYKYEPTFRYSADLFLFRLPFVGKDLKRMAILELAGSLASYTAAGLDIISAAEMSESTLKSYWLKRRVRKFVKETKEGKKWIEAWNDMNLGFPLIDWFASNAAVRENLTSGFMQMMIWLKHDISHYSILFVRVTEIMGLVANTIIVGCVVIAMGMPLFTLPGKLAMGIWQ